MHKRTFFLYSEGRRKALTMSYDDGRVEDRRLVEIFNRHGIKGTFHLCSGLLGNDGFIAADEVAELYKGHEVSCHGFVHKYLTRIGREEVIREMWEDRQELEKLTGYPVRGMSYACGDYNRETVEILRTLGFVYGRTTQSDEKYNLPDDFMTWAPFCHHNQPDLLDKLEQFKQNKAPLSIFYIWGHSFEFERNNNWELIENFCPAAAGDESTWYATNIEIYDYLTAARRLEYSANGRMVKNPNAVPVWLMVDGESVKVNSGELRQLY
jgi:peptidoglycan/xylan/chitin deacetylase (PgdA/CDA1 family)